MNNTQSSSGFRRVGIGRVAINKKRDSNTIEVLPLEDMTAAEGLVSDKWDEIMVDGTDAEGVGYTNRAMFTKTITCQFIGMTEPNRLTSPDVRRGDRVEIYRFGDSSNYYWKTIDNNIDNKKLETVVYGYSATEDENATASPENTYISGTSTHEKIVTIVHTSKANGEEFGFDIYVDTKNSQFIIKDDSGNEVYMQSKEGSITAKVRGGASVQLKGNKISSVGEWNHQGNFTASGDVVGKNVSLASHDHNESVGIKTSPPNKGGPSPSNDPLVKLDYRQPGLLK